MKMTIYCVLDGDVDEFGPLYIAKSDKHAIRNFRSMLKGVPEDVQTSYRLYKTGVYDTDTGVVSGFERPINIVFDSDVGEKIDTISNQLDIARDNARFEEVNDL